MDLTGRVLVLWSGGVESTSLLLRLLQETDAEVYTHFIEMVNPEHRWPKEREAVDALLPRLQAVRPFDHSESTVRICAGEALGWDYAVQYPLGLFVMQFKRCECVLRAGCMEDDWDHVSDMRSGAVRFERPDPAPGASHKRRAKALAASLGAEQHADRLAPYLPSYALPKAAHVAFLGDLFPLTWSCRRPVDGKACGRCHSCKERDAAARGTSLIPEVAEFIRSSHEADR